MSASKKDAMARLVALGGIALFASIPAVTASLPTVPSISTASEATGGGMSA